MSDQEALVAGPSARSRSAADAVRAAREACGWTREQAAEALGVLPVEVAAWEAGTLRPADRHRRWMRWHVETTAADRALVQAGAAPCTWIVGHRERLALRADRSASEADAVRDELRTHRASCAECERVRALTGAMPAVATLPARAGVRGLLRPRGRIEPRSRRFRRFAWIASAAGVLAAFTALEALGVDRDAWKPIAAVVVVLGGIRAARWLDREHGHFAGSLRAAIVIAALVAGAAALAKGWGLLALSWIIPLYFLATGWLARRAPRPDDDPESAG
ncbi:helix-turn-helix transcriptional regulator [Longimicrobium sp.]|uniref:helix-turn-helix domain-containing protein n=1 Tax=Longimicrobium sp. TaxID=2029185 RepID=UPI002E31CDE8|nr:helix-turn-helix transcriptional regulator [Longimicrobium sp.]HEX6040724.1 helix-turn-helix transcriptional regulator [Longimicrobium sp.]